MGLRTPTANSSSHLKPKAAENATEREKEGVERKWRQERIRTDLLDNNMQSLGKVQFYD